MMTSVCSRERSGWIVGAIISICETANLPEYRLFCGCLPWDYANHLEDMFPINCRQIDDFGKLHTARLKEAFARCEVGLVKYRNPLLAHGETSFRILFCFLLSLQFYYVLVIYPISSYWSTGIDYIERKIYLIFLTVITFRGTITIDYGENQFFIEFYGGVSDNNLMCMLPALLC